MQLGTISTWISNTHGHGGSGLKLSGHTGNGYSRGRHKTAIHSRSSGWNIIRRWLGNHPNPPVPCGHEKTTDTMCIPPHSEVMLWAKLKTNNGRRGPTAGVVLALQTFVQEFGILVGRSLVRADAQDWKIPILLYNSDPCTKNSKDCQCNPVIIPARTRIARGGNTGHTEYRNSRDRTQHRRRHTSATLNRCARCSERTHERPARTRSQPFSQNTYTRFRLLEPRSQVERRRWYTTLILDRLDRYAVIQGNYLTRRLKYNKN